MKQIQTYLVILTLMTIVPQYYSQDNITNPTMDYYSGETVTTIVSAQINQQQHETPQQTETQQQKQQQNQTPQQINEQPINLLLESSYFSKITKLNTTIIENWIVSNEWILFSIPGIIVICIILAIIICCVKNKL